MAFVSASVSKTFDMASPPKLSANRWVLFSFDSTFHASIEIERAPEYGSKLVNDGLVAMELGGVDPYDVAAEAVLFALVQEGVAIDSNQARHVARYALQSIAGATAEVEA